MKALSILETALYVSNLVIAEEFYTKILGLKVHSKKDGRHVFLNCEKSMLLLFNAELTLHTKGNVPTHGARGPGHIAFAITIDEFPAWKAHLQKHNIVIESETDWDNGHSIYFRDPSGNSIELTTPDIWTIK